MHVLTVLGFFGVFMKIEIEFYLECYYSTGLVINFDLEKSFYFLNTLCGT